MRVPLEWLNEYVKVGTDDDAIARRLTMGGAEVEGNEPPEEVEAQALKKQIDPGTARAAAQLGRVLDVYITPNRGDCLSLVGIGREVAALYGLPLQPPAPPPSSEGGPIEAETSVTVEDFELCPRYAARLVRNIKVGPSPGWMQARLAAAGQRPINNVVDVTNYVMLELGQPLHAFDLDKLAGGRIVVRRAAPDEQITTLDGVERTLTPSMLVIADAARPVAIAGIMGGATSEVSAATTQILLESAHFNPLSVRRTSRALDLRTEASYRFERIVDPDGVRRALDRACELLTETGQAEVVKGVIDIHAQPVSEHKIALRVRRAAQLLGMEITSHIAADCLRALGFEVQTEPHGDTDTLQVHVPSYRPDVTMEEDLIEEIGRIHGYENIPETLPFGNTTIGGDSALGNLLSQVRNSLVACGLQEVVTHSLSGPSFFDSPEDAARRVAVRNALSAELSGLRRSLLPTLLDAAQHNAAHSHSDLAIFEAGRVWQTDTAGGEPTEYLAVAGLLTGTMLAPAWQRDAQTPAADYGLARGIVERLLSDLGVENAGFVALGDQAAALPQFHPGRTALITIAGKPAGVLGEAHPRLIGRTGLRERVYLFELSLAALQEGARAEGKRYRPFSSKPAVSRDIAPRVAENVPYEAVEKAVRSAAPDFLEELKLTDVYRGESLPEGAKSLTLSFTFRAADRTLAEGEINDALARLRAALETQCGATFA